jgi:hypothetical protein
VRERNPIRNQTSVERPASGAFWSLSWSAIEAALLLFVAYLLLGGLVEFAEFRIVSHLAPTASAGWYLSILLANILATALIAYLLAPAFVGYAGLMLEGSKKTLRAFLQGYRLSGHRLWYPLCVLAPLLFLASVVSSVIVGLTGLSNRVLAEAVSLVLLLIWSALLVWIAASINRVCYELVSVGTETEPASQSNALYTTEDAAPLEEG